MNSFYQFSIDTCKQAAISKELKEGNDHKEEERNSDSSSQLESSDSSVVLEMEHNSSSLSQTSSEELHEASEKNRFTLKGKLIHYCMCESQKYYWHTENLSGIIGR